MRTASALYERLLDAYGKPRWWSDDPLVVMLQAVLVQNTSWASVEKVTASFPVALTPEFLSGLKPEEWEAMIRPCGCAKRKTATLQRLAEWYGKYEYDPDKVKAAAQHVLRGELLGIGGVGAETADVLLVYAFHKPSFIIDAYTRRFLERLGFRFSSDEERRSFFESELPRDAQLYGWYHWLILEHGISHCKKIPACGGCAFADFCSGRTAEI